MGTPSLCLALIHEVFHGAGGVERMGRRLAEAKRGGAELAVLPELPLDPWIPARRGRRDGDAEEPDGPRSRALSDAARSAGLGLLGSAITLDRSGGRRFNRALLFDHGGILVGSYDKLHIPHEDGFWERDHYEPGIEPPRNIEAFALPLGLQICSDLQRPEGIHLLAAQGAAAVLAPRATPQASYERWLTVIRANALTSAAYVVSVNRPESESGVPIGGPSLAVDPYGEVLVESVKPLVWVTLRADEVKAARRSYPGYLEVRSGLYGRAWLETASSIRR